METVDRFNLTKKSLKLLCSAMNEPLDLEGLEIKIVSIQDIMARYIDKADNA